ncbi:hypothetical protein GLOTRDRAFT_62780, partial [Gloeophyllum trabeum ATCC 11539]
MEDGQIEENIFSYSYDPCYEWQGNDDSQSSGPSRQNARPRAVVRFVVLRSAILPKKQTVAVVDGYTQVEFGRDVPPAGSETPRIRLKEMEVSKYHANAYWDAQGQNWAIVDMGSKHGTFLKSSSSAASSSFVIDGERGTRLSSPRVASMPRSLHHLDQLTIGSTTFLIHLHEDGLPCPDCALTDREEVPLFDVRRKRKREEEAAISGSQPGQGGVQKDPKKALSVLKRSLLRRHEESVPSSRSSTPSSSYVDRSARRRALHPSSAPDTPGVPLTAPIAPPPATLQSASGDRSLPPGPRPEPVSAPPTPVPSSNVGHKLLLKQGWQPGTSLGQHDSDRMALVEPLELAASKNRAGLGMR